MRRPTLLKIRSISYIGGRAQLICMRDSPSPPERNILHLGGTGNFGISHGSAQLGILLRSTRRARPFPYSDWFYEKTPHRSVRGALKHTIASKDVRTELCVSHVTYPLMRRESPEYRKNPTTSQQTTSKNTTRISSFARCIGKHTPILNHHDSYVEDARPATPRCFPEWKGGAPKVLREYDA